jgi:2-polyprenyl-3-methyl-5-hydroxy-6-metoxy-1,4-benzoquinol methylase
MEARAAESPVHPDVGWTVGLIRAFCPEARTVCDAGCGIGTLLNGLKAEGFHVKGWDLSQKAAAFAQARFALDVQVGGLESLGADRFDVLIMRHVVEHSLRPLQDLTRAVEGLSPGGIVILVTPNYGSLASRVFERYWEWFTPPAHLYYYSRRAIRHLAHSLQLLIAYEETRKGDARSLPHEWEHNAGLFRVIHWRRYAALRATYPLVRRFYPSLASFLNNHGLGEELVIVLRRCGDLPRSV